VPILFLFFEEIEYLIIFLSHENENSLNQVVPSVVITFMNAFVEILGIIPRMFGTGGKEK
jgi:hypothetical protein